MFIKIKNGITDVKMCQKCEKVKPKTKDSQKKSLQNIPENLKVRELLESKLKSIKCWYANEKTVHISSPSTEIAFRCLENHVFSKPVKSVYNTTNPKWCGQCNQNRTEIRAKYIDLMTPSQHGLMTIKTMSSI